LPADHRLAEALDVEALEVGALSDETLIVPQFEEDRVFTAYVPDFVAAVRLTPEHVYPVRGPPTALSLVGAGVGVALVTESWRSLAMSNVVYREIVDSERVITMVLAYRTRESAPAVLALSRHAKDCGPEREGPLRVDSDPSPTPPSTARLRRNRPLAALEKPRDLRCIYAVGVS
jgi:DNA-binding transcriptional LysR family regulator